MADTPDYNETLEILRAAANKSDLITNKYHDVLVYDENSDIDLGDDEFTPSLSKRVKQFVTSNGGPVLSVNNESGHVVLGDVSNMNKNDLMKAENLYDGLETQKDINKKIIERVVLSSSEDNHLIDKKFTGSLYTNLNHIKDSTYILPKASIGLTFTFVVANNYNLTIKPNNSDNFFNIATGVGVQSDTLGSIVTITAINENIWFFEAKNGTWS